MRSWKRLNQLKSKHRHQFLGLMVALLENGFSLQETIHVIHRTGQFPEPPLEKLVTELRAGQSLPDCLLLLGFSQQQATQVRLAMIHGDIIHTLKTMLEHNELVEKQKKQLQKAAAYPVLLLLFVIGLLLGMRIFLLPSLVQSDMIDQQHWGILFLLYGPTMILGGLGVFFLSGVACQLYFSKQSALKKATFLAQLPLIGEMYRLYQTSYFALEWGRLYKQGLESHQIIEQLAGLSGQQIVSEVAKEVHVGMRNGRTLTQELSVYPFLTKEFPLIVYQGEVKGRLGEELVVYSQLLLLNFVRTIERRIEWIQPLIFLGVAVLVVVIYMAMLLPMYETIGGTIG